MMDEHIKAVREIRVQADKLRLECVKAAGQSTLLHVAYDQAIIDRLPVSQVTLLGKLNKIPY